MRAPKQPKLPKLNVTGKQHLRSCSICSSLSSVLALPSDITTSGVGTSASRAAFVVGVGVSVALNVLHGLVVIVVAAVVSTATGK